jgi:F0F1-type ATP synthase assembly protein I
MPLPEPPEEKRERLRRTAATEMAMSAAWTLVLSSVLGWFGGSRLDRWLGTEPVMMAIGVILGSVGGFIYLYRLSKRLER